MKTRIILLIVFILLISSCGSKQTHKLQSDFNTLASVPTWAKEAIWYQIFVERFRNGDPNNDPTPADMSGGFPEKLPANWKITSWGHDWYSHEAWLEKVEANGFDSKIQARRYGGCV